MATKLGQQAAVEEYAILEALYPDEEITLASLRSKVGIYPARIKIRLDDLLYADLIDNFGGSYTYYLTDKGKACLEKITNDDGMPITAYNYGWKTTIVSNIDGGSE